MSMRDSPCSGYTIEAKKLIPMLPADVRERVEELLEDGEDECVGEILIDELPKLGFPPPADTFRLSDVDTPGDDMDGSELHVRFDEEDLFTKAMTPAGISMDLRGAFPEHHRWSTWG